MTPEQYVVSYPGYCRICEGRGLHKGFKPNIWFKDCDCVQEGRCPRCGIQGAEFERSRECAACGWNMDDKERGLPGSETV
jgi:ribosomal protein L37E